MMEILLLYNREYTSRRGLCSSFGSKSNFLENLKCIRADQHLIEGTDGDIIPPLACSFNNVATNLIAIADEDGGILILDSRASGLDAIKQEWRAHKNAIFDIEWVQGEYRLLTASGDQTAKLWDISTETAVSTFKGHASSIKTIRCSEDPNIFATGARDGHVMVWDARVKAKSGYIPAVNTIQNAHTIVPPDAGSATKKKRTAKNQQQHNSQQTVTAVVFQDENTLITAGSVDGSVKLWDMRKNYSILKSEPIAIHKFPYAGNSARSHGFSSLTLDSTRTRLFANCMDNTVYLYDCAGLNTKPVASYRGHTNSSFYVKTALSPDDVFLLSGSTDKKAYIWRVEEPYRSPLVLTGHTDEVSAVAWSPTEHTTLVTLSDDCTVCTWRAMSDIKTNKANEGPSDFIMGTAEWTHKDIGVGAGGPSCAPTSLNLSSVILTPSRRLATGHLQSPSASPQTTPVKTARPKVTGVTPKAAGISPNVSRGAKRAAPVREVPGLLSSPPLFSEHSGSTTPKKRVESLLKSPRDSPKQLHVLLSPRKTPIPGCFDALSPRKTPQRGAGGSPLSYVQAARSVKRKLCSESEVDGSPRKRVRADASLSMAGVAPLGTPCRTLMPSENITPAKTTRQNLNFSDSNMDKVAQSPTVNLPNYVLNPEPRTPQPLRRQDTTKENCQKNWLVELRQRKEAEKEGDVGEAQPASPQGTPSRQGTPRHSAGTPRGPAGTPRGPAGTPRGPVATSRQVTPRGAASSSTPRTSSRKASKGTPTSSSKLKTPTTRRSIMTYFSPKEHSK